MKKIDSILKEVLKQIEPSKEDLKVIDNSLKEITDKIRQKIKKLRINAEIFIGGSFAKNTVIKKDKYDVDIFIRFDKKHEKQGISKLALEILKGMKNIEIVHGSRDYFVIKISPEFVIELIPVIKISKPEQAENITDLSYSHVNYIRKKIKNDKILDEIRIAKAFCYATNCYGAESYISGFSGYALELLVYYYKGFLKFLRAMIKLDGKKEIIDIEKHFKKKTDVLMDLNASKLFSPVILIDPTFRQRNALAALSKETFEKFKNAAKDFLRNPKLEAFEDKKTDIEKIKKDALRKKQEFILLQAETEKQEGDIAGSKLLKFYKHLETEIEKLFEIKNRGFNYNGKKAARFFFVAKNKGEIISAGPKADDKESVAKFKAKHKNTFEKSGRVFARDKITHSLKEFINLWSKKNAQKVKEMYLVKLNVL